jgi:CHAT domain
MKKSIHEETSNPAPPTISAQWHDGNDEFLTFIDQGFGSVPVKFAAPYSKGEIKYLAESVLKIAEGPRFVPSSFQALDEADRQDEVRGLAKAGNYLFRAIVDHENGDRSEFLRLLGTEELGWLVMVRFPATMIPWELLYIDEVPHTGDVKLSGFLGAKYLLSKAARPKGPESSVWANSASRASDPFSVVKEFPSQSAMTIGHIWDDTLPMFRDTAPAQHWYARLHPRLRREELVPLSSAKTSRSAMEATIIEFLQRPNDSVHFDCDGTPHDEKAPERIQIQVRSQYKIEYSDVKLWSFRPNAEIMAFLNICSSDRASLQQSPTIAEMLHSRGARAVIATTAKVPQSLAARIAEAVYGGLLRGKAIGKALFDSRSQLVRSTGNPIALLWTMYGSPTQSYVSGLEDVPEPANIDRPANPPAVAA